MYLADGEAVDFSFGDDELFTTCKKVLTKKAVLEIADGLEGFVWVSYFLSDDGSGFITVVSELGGFIMSEAFIVSIEFTGFL